MRYRLAMFLALFVSHGFADNEPRTEIALKSQGSQTLYIESTIHGAGAARLLVDTGSGYSVINEVTLNALLDTGGAQFLNTIQGVMADGSTREVPLYQIDRIVLDDQCVLRDVKAVVFEGSGREILGISALMKTAPFEIAADPMRLRLGHCEAVEDEIVSST